MNEKSKKLREMLKGDSLVVLPGVYDCVSAKAAVMAGFEVVFMSGFAVSASKLGLPDYGFLTATEMIAAVSQISESIDVPLIADIDTGYGNPLNVYRTVQDAVKAGAAGVFLEDQKWPKRCGHMTGKKIISEAEHVEKIKAAIEARGDSGLVIVARTDARSVEGLDGAIRRGRAFEKAGADVIFIEAPETMLELREIAKAFPKTPCLANMIEHGKTPFLSAAELQEIGFKAAVFPLSGLFGAAAVLQKVYEHLKGTGTTKDSGCPMLAFEDFTRFIDLQKFRDRELKFSC